ncbi:MAG: hypothetical protein APU95_00250 [Hadesarchaea archaeon YNP_N21]|jgi:hypothetical protein|nr:MAG: hypothetical protein APU95_00250 [Hadesarchaea archaeon YNP_N21]
MSIDEKVAERKLLLDRAFSKNKLFEIGKRLGIPYFNGFVSGWEVDGEEACLEIASGVNDDQLKKIFEEHRARDWAIFRGKYYTLENGDLRLEGSWRTIGANIQRMKKKYGKVLSDVMKKIVSSGEGCSSAEIGEVLGRGADPRPILSELERLKIIVQSYKGEEYREWKVLEETCPLIQNELGLLPVEKVKTAEKREKVDYVALERQNVAAMDGELEGYLNDLLKHRLKETIEFGKRFSIVGLANYLQGLFGSVLFFDSLLSIAQQYGLADVEIVHSGGRTGMRTGWSLALFGEPGTGKTFATKDMILGRPDGRVMPHGVPGRNRYCGGITPARFIRIGQAYAGRVFNFIVPEFNDWFRYAGMVDVLKLAMERGEIKYETHKEVIGPYRFSSFLSVNYNTKVFERGYEVTVSDPNFNAIEDRMICRLHRLTKKRYAEIARSQMRLALGEIDIEKGAQKIRDHVTLVYAIEAGHPLVADRFPYKPVMITHQTYEAIERARNAILEKIPHEVVRFSARLENRAIRFACAASLLNYFQSDLDCVPVSEDALKYAIQLYVEEASARSREEFKPEEILEELASSPP